MVKNVHGHGRRNNEKIEVMTAVINEMATQRKELIRQMTETQPQMMGHVMSHMQMGPGDLI